MWGRLRILPFKTKHSSKLNIIYENHAIKQCHSEEYLGCHLDSNISEESMVLNVF